MILGHSKERVCTVLSVTQCISCHNPVVHLVFSGCKRPHGTRRQSHVCPQPLTKLEGVDYIASTHQTRTTHTKKPCTLLSVTVTVTVAVTVTVTVTVTNSKRPSTPRPGMTFCAH